MDTNPLYNERELLLQIANDDERAFESLIAHYSSILYGHVLSYLKDPGRAEEITQDIFLNIWNLRAQLPAVEHFRAYLFRAARNRTISAFRTQLAHTVSAEALEIESPYSTPAEQIEYEELTAAVLNALEKLPTRRKEIFLLSRQQGKTHEEIARSLSISRSAVNQHIIEALIFLRTHLRHTLPAGVLIVNVLSSGLH